ncbi:MAG: restriction endonuclease [Candidatus Gracilibacteria bacterium]|nr:restriction endonuclease [Candidatus Gracilibacteria bacterium]
MNSELAKLIYDLKGDEKSAFNVYNIRKKLTASGFEYYIAFYFEKILGYKIKITNNVYNADGGIDLKGIRKNKDGITEYCIIQCKKHSSTSFGINYIREFVGAIYHILLNFPATKAYYITTSVFSEPAIKYAEKECISLKNYKNILNIYNQYSLIDFEKDIIELIPEKYNTIFNKGKKIKESKWQGKLFYSQEDELLTTLKEIRYKLMKKLHIIEKNEITNDKILEYLSIKRPHNLEALKNSLYEGEFNKEEISKTINYADEYLKGIILYI